MDDLITVWDGAVRRQIETITVTTDDLRSFTVQRVVRDHDELLPSRSSGNYLGEAIAEETPSTKRKRSQQKLVRMTPKQLADIAGLLAAGWGVRAIGRKIGVPYSTVQAHIGGRYASRRRRAA